MRQNKFKPGDRVVYIGTCMETNRRIERCPKPYLTVDYYKTYENWVTFKDEPMRTTDDPEIYPNGYHEFHFDFYKDPNILSDELFEL